jgi:hypothetical protein
MLVVLDYEESLHGFMRAGDNGLSHIGERPQTFVECVRGGRCGFHKVMMLEYIGLTQRTIHGPDYHQ